MIITDAQGIGTELGLRPTPTLISTPSFPRSLGNRAKEGVLAVSLCLFLKAVRMRGDEIDDLASGFLNSLPCDTHHGPALHLAQAQAIA
jgi:hypothetical protein